MCTPIYIGTETHMCNTYTSHTYLGMLMCVYTDMHMHTQREIRTRPYIHTATHVCTHRRAYAHNAILTHSHIYTHVCTHMHTNAHTNTDRYIYKHIHRCSYVHIEFTGILTGKLFTAV